MDKNFHEQQEDVVVTKIVKFEKQDNKIKISKIGKETTELMTPEQFEELINQMQVLKWLLIKTGEC
jgi:hypothetical protein